MCLLASINYPVTGTQFFKHVERGIMNLCFSKSYPWSLLLTWRLISELRYKGNSRQQ